MPRYRVYGLTLEAEFPLPELIEVHGENGAPQSDADVHVRLLASEQPEEAGCFARWLGPGAILNQFPGVARFAVHDGRAIHVDVALGADVALVRHLLLGPVFAQVLWLREKFVLHGCVLRVGSRQLAFVGMSGAGKSTLAIALHRAGHTLVCDDVAALERRAEAVLVQPALPRMRAFADTLERLGESREGLERAHRELEKWLLPARQFAEQALPLERVYVLDVGEDFALEPLTKAESMLALMRNTYYAEQHVGLFGAERHMKAAAALASGLTVERLVRPRAWERIDDLVQFVERCAATPTRA